MVADAQVFRYHRTTTRVHLGGVLGINACHTPTSLYRFVRGELHELIPGHIRNAPVDDLVPVRLHRLSFQILKGDELIVVYQLTACLVREVFTPVRLALIGVLQRVNRLLALWATFWPVFFLRCRRVISFASPLHPMF